MLFEFKIQIKNIKRGNRKVKYGFKLTDDRNILGFDRTFKSGGGKLYLNIERL